MPNKILVTGADGFIGSHLVERLVDDGHDVRAVTYYNSFGSNGWLDKVDRRKVAAMEISTGDVRDAGFMRQVVKNCGTVFHLAALIGIPYSYVAPESYIETNVKGTLNVLLACRDQGDTHMIQTSTSEVYGTARYAPMDEEHPLQAQSPYSASKIGADQLALSFHRSFATPVTILRPFNTFGPRQSTRAIIPTIITQILGGTSAIKLGTLSPTRDMNFVQDTVDGFVACLNNRGAVGEVVNIGSGFEIGMGDLAKLIAELIGRDIEIVTDPQRLRPNNSEVQRLCAANDKAASLLGWRPRLPGLAGLRQGLEKTIAWFSDPLHRNDHAGERYHV